MIIDFGYLASKKYKDAEITSLESIRINPEKIDYTLTFLRVSQKIKSEYLFISELIIAFKKFPDNSEITLMLARAYDRTGKNKARALEYYKKFISLSPNNPFREEAENAILRLSRNS